VVRFFVVEPIYPDSNIRFDMHVIFMTNYFLIVDDISVDSETFLMINL
jgi:hypothetical protein